MVCWVFPVGFIVFCHFIGFSNMLFVMFMFGVVILILFLLLVKRVVIRCYFFDELNYVFFPWKYNFHTVVFEMTQRYVSGVHYPPLLS